jgi:hypothetical protein
MSARRHSLARFVRVITLGAAILGTSTRAAQAQPTASDAIRASQSGADLARMRADLDQINAEIATLKRGGRGIRDDFRLRRRMADAEALARKLTEAEAVLRAGAGRRGAPPSSAGALEAPAVLEARADVLEDQARRFANQADALARTAAELRGRQLLRRRVGQLERDPFAGVDGAKRTMVVAGPRVIEATGARALGPGTPGGARGGSGVSEQPSPATARAVDFAGPQPSAGPAMAAGAASAAPPGAPGGAPGAPAPPTTGGAAPPSPSPSTPTVAPAPTPEAAPASPGPIAPSPSAGSNPAAPPAAVGGPSATAIPAQLRAFLDPATAAELRRLEVAGLAGADPASVERVAAALRARAQHLSGQARDLRQKAQAK